MAPSSSGLGRLVLSQEIRGSNPLGATTFEAENYRQIVFRFFAFSISTSKVIVNLARTHGITLCGDRLVSRTGSKLVLKMICANILGDPSHHGTASSCLRNMAIMS